MADLSATDLDIKDVVRVHLEPGDFLAVNCDFNVTPDMAKRMNEMFERFSVLLGRETPIPVLILEKGMRLTVVGPSPEGVTDG